MTRRLYTFRLSEDSLQSEGNSTRKALDRLSQVDNLGSVSSTGSEPGDVSLDGQLRDDFAELLGTELRELLQAPGIEYLEYYAVDRETPDAGYYPADQNRGGRVQPQTGGVVTFDLELVREGTRGSHRRRIQTRPASVEHQFGTATDAPVGVPAAARDVHWLDSDGTTRAPASPATTLSAEFGSVALYRADQAPTGDSPQLVYDLPHEHAGDVDAALFDTWNNPERDTQGRFAWQQVHAPDHEYRGEAIIENGLVQARIDLATDPHEVSVTGYTNGSWSTASLGSSPWRLAAIDIRDISPVAVRARTRWTDTSGAATHTLDMALHRGFTRFQFTEPTTADGSLIQSQQAPQGLVDRLDPIASAVRTDPDPRRGLIARTQLPL